MNERIILEKLLDIHKQIELCEDAKKEQSTEISNYNYFIDTLKLDHVKVNNIQANCKNMFDMLFDQKIEELNKQKDKLNEQYLELFS